MPNAPELLRKALGIPDAVVDRQRAVEEFIWFQLADRPLNDARHEQRRTHLSRALPAEIVEGLEAGWFDKLLMGWETTEELVARLLNQTELSIGARNEEHRIAATIVVDRIRAYVAAHPFDD